jgi:hypothetical protein
MHYNVDYSGMPEDEQVKKALKDIKEFWGTTHYKKCVKALQEDAGRTSRRVLIMGMSFSGVEGFPAEAFVDTYWNPQMELELVGGFKQYRSK